MVLLSQVHASNASVSTALPPNPIAIFVGGTSGIGLYMLKAFVKHASQPKVYFVGRSQEAGAQITAECRTLSPEGEYIFIQSDVSLLKNVDVVCREIKEKEDHVNLLVLSQGTLVFNTETAEGLNYAAALVHYSRVRFILNLLPLLRKATGLRRVVSVFAATKEGKVYTSDLQGNKEVPLVAGRGHRASLVTYGLESLAQRAPEVGFVHVFPGAVKSGIGRGTTGVIWALIKVVFSVWLYFMGVDVDECGERHLFLGTSQRYKSKEGDAYGVALGEGVEVAIGSNGQVGSGVYTVDEFGESAEQKVLDLLAGMRKEGVVEKAWELTMEDFKRVVGSESI